MSSPPSIMGNTTSEPQYLDYPARARKAREAQLANSSLVQATYYVHPIHRLPPEILLHVFLELYALRPTADHEYEEPSISEAPLLLTRICRPWRSMALGIHEMWASIQVPLNMPPQTLELWLEHCRTIRLAIQFSLAGEQLRMALRYIDRWESFQFSLVGVAAKGDLGFYIGCLHTQGIAINLETLIFTIGQNESKGDPLINNYQYFFETLARRSPKLHRVEWTTPWCSYKNETLPWSQLTHLTLRSVSMTSEMAYRVLFTAHKTLQVYDVVIPMCDHPHIHDAFPILQLSCLTRLRIEVQLMDSLWVFLPKLCMPALQSLYIHANIVPSREGEIVQWPHDELFELFARSKPPLGRLVLQSNSTVCSQLCISIDQLMHYLDNLPHLYVMAFSSEMGVQPDAEDVDRFMEGRKWIRDDVLAGDVYGWGTASRRAYYRA